MAVIVGAALLLSAAPAIVSAKVPQAKTPPAAKQPAPSKKSGKPSKNKRARARAQSVPTPDRIREIQSALAQKKFYEGEPNGKWDARAVEAMKRFQEANGLTATGKLDARSLQKLGLGSEVAGAAAPRVPASEIKPLPPKP